MAKATKAKTIPIVIDVIVHDETVMMLHEEVATGEVNGSTVRVIRSLNGTTTHVQFKDKSYQIDTMAIVRAILARVEEPK